MAANPAHRNQAYTAEKLAAAALIAGCSEKGDSSAQAENKDATGSDAGDYPVAGPDWKGETPAGIKKVFRSTTRFSVAACRTQLFGADKTNVTAPGCRRLEVEARSGA